MDKGSPGYHPSTVVGDVNHDSVVNILDLVLVASQFGTTGPSIADLNGDNTTNIQDLVLVANALNAVAGAPGCEAAHSSNGQQLVTTCATEYTGQC